MTHWSAKKWDEENGNVVAKHVVEDGKFIPAKRPCDWCGMEVESGWIHKGCAEKEAKMLLDIIY